MQNLAGWPALWRAMTSCLGRNLNCLEHATRSGQTAHHASLPRLDPALRAPAFRRRHDRRVRDGQFHVSACRPAEHADQSSSSISRSRRSRSSFCTASPRTPRAAPTNSRRAGRPSFPWRRSSHWADCGAGFSSSTHASAVLLASWPFLLVLVAIFIGNEVFKQYYERLVFTATLLFFGMFSYAIVTVPIYIHQIGVFRVPLERPCRDHRVHNLPVGAVPVRAQGICRCEMADHRRRNARLCADQSVLVHEYPAAAARRAGEVRASTPT